MGPHFRAEPNAYTERLEELMRAAAPAGAASLRTFIGAQFQIAPDSVVRRMDDLRHDPARPGVPWDRQLSDTTEVLRRLAPVARDLGIRLALETHLDATSFQLLRLIEAIG